MLKGQLWLGPLFKTGPTSVSDPVLNYIRLLRTSLSWDTPVTKDGDALFSGPCLNDWPIPIVKNFFLIPPWRYLCPLPHILSHCTSEEKSVSIFLIYSYYTAETSSKFPSHTLFQSSLLQAKQTHLSASPRTLCGPVSDHLDAPLGLFQYVHVCLVLA